VVGDTYLMRGDGTNSLHGSETTMLLKNDTSVNPAGYDRDIYLRFDISDLNNLNAGVVATNACLKIYLIGEGINTNHNIYVAIIDEDAMAEQFNELTLAPSSDPPSNNDLWSAANDEAIEGRKIYGGTSVGSFEISSSNEHTTISFDSPGLLQAICDDTDGVLSMVLYRTINNSNTDSFASKENDTYPPSIIEVNFWKPKTGILIIVF